MATRFDVRAISTANVVVRAGGDALVVVLDQPDERGARELVERIRAAADRVWQSPPRPSHGPRCCG
ncbi:hypothetical protein [Streptomyces sp. SID13031]|uniref:hypothetical protein n=1 Tax=Streptomyces sp. SID13031 TaxID=2706046 RepID=UPI001943BBFE|nr:hypothetical protein [Streptomyces sp. SID13031]